MDINNTVIMVNYRKKPTACHCCGRAYANDDSKYGEVEQHEFTARGFFEWIDWADAERFAEHVPIYAGRVNDAELAENVEEYVHNTLNFYACKHDELLEIEHKELDKVFEAVKSEVLRLQNP